ASLKHGIWITSFMPLSLLVSRDSCKLSYHDPGPMPNPCGLCAATFYGTTFATDKDRRLMNGLRSLKTGWLVRTQSSHVVM
ncbi:MAG: hypothetical protein PHY79_24490, partial [Anaerolineae bacterium]|nr:hypothetical protein [Anaerolineae bacterium]